MCSPQSIFRLNFSVVTNESIPYIWPYPAYQSMLLRYETLWGQGVFLLLEELSNSK